PPPLVSPELTAGGDVILRLRAPEAETVRLTSGGDIPGLAPGVGSELTNDGEGVWSITLESLRPGAFRYNFNVDGVSTLDPSNPLTSESRNSSWSLFHVPGDAFMDTARVPHGAVAEVTYWSETFDQHRRMHVYTPPGYENGRGRFPVFYLSHGAGDSDDAWSTVGRAGFILDNLIAAGDAVPMIVVMPDGHPPAQGSGPGGMQIAEFAVEFAADIKPYVEANYRVRTGRADTAIAGLSMGGAHTLEITIADLAEYGYIGVFSSGVFGIADSDEWPTEHAAALGDASLKNGLEYFWFAIGDEDFLLDTAKASVDMFEEHGFDIVYHESGGGHTWINWREYLHEFAQVIFK
ncbi:MAG: alpha/beta hydrolase-fold protein, partial [Gammaproteobacteria bacterium]|nr:alpha/beta hydrolase-fold protein [Gammaproteobacteria bacterium]